MHGGIRTEGLAALRRAWESSQRSTKEDWAEWMRNFAIELLKQSPSKALRACASLAQVWYGGAVVRSRARLPCRQLPACTAFISQGALIHHHPAAHSHLLWACPADQPRHGARAVCRRLCLLLERAGRGHAGGAATRGMSCCLCDAAEMLHTALAAAWPASRCKHSAQVEAPALPALQARPCSKPARRVLCLSEHPPPLGCHSPRRPQEQLVRSLEAALASPTIPPDIVTTLLNLAEFMEHDEKALPLDTRCGGGGDGHGAWLGLPVRAAATKSNESDTFKYLRLGTSIHCKPEPC